MSAILLAVFDDYEVAERIRTELVRDGFPTDRVELTAACESGRASIEPAGSAHERYLQYFRTLFSDDGERECAERLADRVDHGAATITVHPRGLIEATRATEILEGAHPAQIAKHDLANHVLEHAAARHEQPWIRNFWIDSRSSADCLYCRLFEGHSMADG